MFYTTSWVECNGSCNGKEFMCSGGDMYAYYSTAPHRRRVVGNNPYIYTWCSLLDKVCSWYNVTETEYNQYNDYWAYTGCTKYGVENNACVTGSTFYKLEYCYQM